MASVAVACVSSIGGRMDLSKGSMLLNTHLGTKKICIIAIESHRGVT
jgi:hypothetical protein